MNSKSTNIHQTHDIAFRLASLGAKPHTIAAALGITLAELRSLPEYNQALADVIKTGKLKGVGDTLQHLNDAASKGNVQAILALLSIHDAEYNVSKASVEITNNVATLPTAQEAREIIQADPALGLETGKD